MRNHGMVSDTNRSNGASILKRVCLLRGWAPLYYEGEPLVMRHDRMRNYSVESCQQCSIPVSGMRNYGM